MVFVIMFLGCFMHAQVVDYQKIIDSIAQKKWDSTSVELDSLANPKIVDIRSIKKDSVKITNNVIIIPNSNDASPLTPSSILTLPTLKRWFIF